MLSLLIVSLVAGVCYGQEQGKYSDCANVETISSECSTAHLGYLKALSEPKYAEMAMVSKIDTPSYLLNVVKLEVCNNTMDLKKYYVCVFTNLTTCLKEENSTQLKGVPDADNIAKGVVELCEDREEMNGTCIVEKMAEVESCFGAMMGKQDESMDNCMMYEELIICTDKLDSCEGNEVVKDFVVSARPHSCSADDTGAAVQYQASAVLVASLLLSRLL